MYLFSRPPSRTQRFCPACKRNVLALLDPKDPGTTPEMTWALVLFTCGLMLPVFLVARLSYRPTFLCPQCGTLTRPAGRSP